MVRVKPWKRRPDASFAAGSFHAHGPPGSNQVIASYSTSFGAATRLLGRRHRQHIRNVYALVRVADELVDGVAQEAGLTVADQEVALAAFVDETHSALRRGYSSNLVIHAFAHTARLVGIGPELIDPFFTSMRTDLESEPDGVVATFSAAAREAYVYGSAEVVGLMCLQVFLYQERRSPDELALLRLGARNLGAAFQDINFLRDLADDTDRLRRSYLAPTPRLTAAQRDECLQRINKSLATAKNAMALLPADARVAVQSATELFTALAERLAKAEISDLYQQRMRLPGPAKAAIIGRALVRSRRA